MTETIISLAVVGLLIIFIWARLATKFAWRVKEAHVPRPQPFDWFAGGLLSLLTIIFWPIVLTVWVSYRLGIIAWLRHLFFPDPKDITRHDF